MSQGAGPRAPAIANEVHLCTIVFFQSGGKLYIWIVYTWGESVGVLQVTGSLLHVVLVCRLAKLRLFVLSVSKSTAILYRCYILGVVLVISVGLFRRRDGNWEQSARG